MKPDDEFRIKHAVEERLIDYWRDVDSDDAKNALEFYTQDCVYLMCGHRMQGHAPIRAYYDYRGSRGPRLVRHVLTNVRVQVVATDRATLDGTLCVHAGDGVPVLPAAPPILVADTGCEFVMGADGKWRMQLHRITALFAGGVDVLVPPPAV